MLANVHLSINERTILGLRWTEALDRMVPDGQVGHGQCGRAYPIPSRSSRQNIQDGQHAISELKIT